MFQENEEFADTVHPSVNIFLAWLRENFAFYRKWVFIT